MLQPRLFLTARARHTTRCLSTVELVWVKPTCSKRSVTPCLPKTFTLKFYTSVQKSSPTSLWLRSKKDAEKNLRTATVTLTSYSLTTFNLLQAKSKHKKSFFTPSTSCTSKENR